MFGLFHLFRVERLVNHAGNLAIAAQWQPAHTVLRVAVFRFELEEGAVPLADADVEEHVELLDAHAEEFREKEVATLVQEHKQ